MFIVACSGIAVRMPEHRLGWTHRYRFGDWSISGRVDGFDAHT
jgi:hypothetical protein